MCGGGIPKRFREGGGLPGGLSRGASAPGLNLTLEALQRVESGFEGAGTEGAERSSQGVQSCGCLWDELGTRAWCHLGRERVHDIVWDVVGFVFIWILLQSFS